jgi:dTDP-4-dehydrorhamnose reductase
MGRVEFAEVVARAYGLDATLLRPRATMELGLAAPRPLRAGLRTTKLREALGRSLTDPLVALRELASRDTPPD